MDFEIIGELSSVDEAHGVGKRKIKLKRLLD
jgi:hypothetical protein